MSNFPDLAKARCVPSDTGGRRRTKPSRRYRPRPDVLEERRVLTPFLWTGAVNNNWTNPGNWVMLRPPNNNSTYPSTPQDYADFDTANAAGQVVRPNVNLNANITVGNVQISPTYPGTITLSTGNTAHILTVTRQYQQYGGTIAGPGTLFLGAAGGAATSDIISGPAKIAGGNALVDVRSGSTLGIQGTEMGPDKFVTFDHAELKIEAGGGVSLGGNPEVSTDTVNLVNSEILDQGTLITIGWVTVQSDDAPNAAPSSVVVARGGAFDVNPSPQISRAQMDVPFDNFGTVTRNDTQMVLTAGGISSGTYVEKGAEATLAFSQPIGAPEQDYLWLSGTTFDGTAGGGGLVQGVGVYANVVARGTVNINATPFTLDGGSIAGLATLMVQQGSQFTLTGNAVVDRATIQIAAPAGNQAGGTLILGDGTLQRRGVINNDNSATLQVGNFTLNTSAQIVNGARSTFNLQDDSNILGDGSGTFTNEAGGTVTKSTGNGQATIDKMVTFTNLGSVIATAGILKIQKYVQQGAGSKTEMNGAKVQLNTDGLLQLEGGVLENIGPDTQDGEVFGDVLNTGGVVEPGGPGATGILAIDGTDGTYTQSGKGALDIDLGNPTPGTGSDQLIVTGTITLGGTLDVNTLPGFTGDSFTIIKNESPGPVVGQFHRLPEGATLTLDGRTFKITYEGGTDGQDVVLNAVATLPTVTTVVASTNPSVYGQPASFTATVAPAGLGGGVPTGTVQFQVDGANFGAPVLLSAGTATSGSLGTMAPGPHTVTALYSGGGLFLASSGSLNQTVNQAATAVTVVSSDPNEVYGEPLTFTATVVSTSPGAGVPTGTVAFHTLLGNGSDETLGTGTLGATGTAIFQMPTGMAIGTRGIYAVYLGDTNFSGSTSAMITQNVNQAATTLQVTSSAPVIVAGEAVTFNETLFVVPPGSFVTAPTGTITLYDTFDGVTTALSTVTIGGTVNFPSLTEVGVHYIFAVYSGDGNFLGCTSPTITETVVAPG